MVAVLHTMIHPHRYWTRMMLLTVSIVLLGLFISTTLSLLETKRRLRLIEQHHQLIVNEMSRTDDKTQLADAAIQRAENRRQYQQHLTSLGTFSKIVTELEQIKSQSKIINPVDQQWDRTDFALSTAGADILSTGRTEVMITPLPQWLISFGFARISKYFRNGALRMIQPSVEPGECFAFSGRGEVVIALIKSVFIQAISVEHIPKQISPDGNISSAPTGFSAYGLESVNDPCPLHLGTFRYDNTKNQPRQIFETSQNASEKSFPIVKFEFAPNLNYTCVYRVRVHGSLIKPN